MTSNKAYARALVWYGAAFALLGACVGLLAGLSRSPIVGILLPLLFGLMAGAGGLYLAGIDLDDEKARAKLQALGSVLSAFTVCVIVASVYGSLLRTGASIGSLVPSFQVGSGEPKLEVGKDQAALSVSSRIELLMLRWRLEALGATEDEKRQILAAAMSAIVPPYGGEAMSQLLLRLQALARQAREALDRDRTPAEENSHSDVPAQIASMIEGFEDDYGALAERAKSASVPSISDLRARLSGDKDSLAQVIHTQGSVAWLNGHGAARDSLWRLELALVEETTHIDDGEWLSGGRLAHDVNALLTTLSAQGSSSNSAEDTLRPSFAP